MLPIFPFSPLPAALQRTRDWGENTNIYDSGESQGDTSWLRPMLRWTVPVQLMNELKEGPLVDFVDQTQGMTKPFLIKDAYEFRVNSQIAVRSGITNGATGYFTDTKGFQIRPDTVTVGSLFSVLSGFVTFGSEYTIEQDTGIVLVNTKAVGDIWGVRSIQYFRKARFSQQYDDTATIWNIFTTQMQIMELP